MPFEGMRPNYERANTSYRQNVRKGDSGDPVPAGTYLVVITDCQLTQSKDQSKDLINFPCEVVRAIGPNADQITAAQQGRVVRGFTTVPDASEDDWRWNLIRQLALVGGYDENQEGASIAGVVEAARGKYALAGVVVKDNNYGPQSQTSWLRKPPPDMLADLPERSTEDSDIPF